MTAGQAFQSPKNILMIKAHSAGIGDLLRSSAAWRALKNRFPEANLHLWFLTKDPGAAAEQLIARHHLLSSFQVSDKRGSGAERRQNLHAEAREIARRTDPNLVVDFEPNGFRTSLLSWRLRRWTGATTVGVAQVPFRRWLYSFAAPSSKNYALRHGMDLPLEYTERDFVALSALGIERQGIAIELAETEEGRGFRTRVLEQLGGKQVTHKSSGSELLTRPAGGFSLCPSPPAIASATAGEGARERPILGLNIGCGTEDAIPKRPNLDLLRGLIGELARKHGFALLLTGAPYEQEIVAEFLSHLLPPGPVIDLAGRTDLLELAGAISACRLFVSSDSGPYHMAVALRVPTLALFNWPNPQHYHHHEWVECHVASGPESLRPMVEAAERLLRITPPPRPAAKP